MSRGVIGVRGHRVRCWVGMEPHEKVHPQELLFDIDVQYEMGEAVASDDIARGVNYVDLAHLVSEVAHAGHVHLIERLASLIVDTVFDRFPKVTWVRTRIEKPHAVSTAAYTFAELERDRP